MSWFEGQWWGAPALDDSKMAWGARAIFHPRLEHPLDLLHDRQGYSMDGKSWLNADNENPEKVKRLREFLNAIPLKELHKIAKNFYPEGSDQFSKKFDWPHDDGLVMVARGGPNASFGYFYVSVSLVPKEGAPEDVKSDRETEGEWHEKQMKEWRDTEELMRPIRVEENRKLREEAKEHRAIVEEKIEESREAPREGKVSPGDHMKTYANQGMRDAFVLAVIGDEALLEYFMPAGGRFLRIIKADDRDDTGRSVSEARLTKKWKREQHEA